MEKKLKTLGKIVGGISLVVLFSFLPLKSRAQNIKNGFFSLDTLNYDSLTVQLADRNNDKNNDKIIYVYYMPESKLVLESKDNDFDGFFESGDYKSFNNKGTMVSTGRIYLDDISQVIKDLQKREYKVNRR